MALSYKTALTTINNIFNVKTSLMKKAKKLLMIIGAIYLALSCVETGTIDHTGVTVIELDPDKTEAIFLDSIVHNVRFVPLQTTSECLIESYSDIRLTGGKIFIHSDTPVQDAIFVFDMNGAFLFKIDSRGRGPGEYLEIKGFHVNVESGEILISDVNKILIYDFNGMFLKSHSLEGFDPLGDLAFFSDCYFLCAVSYEELQYSDKTINFMVKFDKDLNLISHTLPINKRYYFSTHFRRSQLLIHHKDTLFYIDPESPVIFTYDKEGFLPRYAYNYGAYNVSKEHEIKFYELDGPNLAAMEYARVNKLAFPGSETFYFSDKYIFIETIISYDNYRFFYNPDNGKSVRLQGKSSTFRAMYPSLVRCYENQFFGVKEASGILHSRDRLIEFKNEKSAMSLDLSGPFSHTHFSRFDSIKPDDNAIIVFFDIKDDFLK